MAKDIWQSLLIIHQGNSQVKDNKIEFLVQQYEQFTILEEESIDSGFARFDTIIASLKALDEGFSSKNYVRKFFRALHPKWRAKVMKNEESKDLSSLALDELIKNLKVHEVVIEKISKSIKAKRNELRTLKSSLEERVNLFGNQEKKGSHSDKEMRRKERVTKNVLDAVIQVILLAIIQKHLATKIKRLSLEVIGAIARMTPKTKPMMKLVSWLNRQMRTRTMSFVGSPVNKITDGSTIKGHGSILLGSVSCKDSEIGTEHACSPPMSSRSDFVITRKKLIHNSIDESKKPSLKPSLKGDHGREFYNEVQFEAYCDALGISHNFSAPCTPQSNGVVERKNRTLQEMSRTMLNEQSIPQKFWCNAVDTLTYILHRILIRLILGKTPYEIFRGKKPSLEYFKLFGSKFFILNTKDHLTKFYPKSYEGVFLGYSQNSKAYVVLNKHTMKVEESLNVIFDESPPPTKLSPLVDDYVGEEEAIRKNTKFQTNQESDVNENQAHQDDEADSVDNFKYREAEYVFAGKACQQVLWMKQALINYGIRLHNVPIMCDNKGAIDLSKNPIQNSRTKHIEIHHHFLRDNFQKGNISIEKVASEDNIADIFTKPLKRKVFNYLRLGLGMMELIMDSDPPSSQK
nr:retrovirus-related Pol polyprotein from transposon TNT 1-94 [Tanacetum cinerariifolium]